MYASVFVVVLLAASTISPALSIPHAIPGVHVARRDSSLLAARDPDTPTPVKIRSNDAAARLRGRQVKCGQGGDCQWQWINGQRVCVCNND
ncbi:hypothetical protein EI94DRAFT_1751638 [Lactarius quietus]|nr:hypothetical protein EI94DRAFT_1751638 [Lactarius quietus]